ncbi:MAG: formimidoylglutamate deiminase [Granulosicoccus sp.]
MKIICAKQALLPEGWVSNVRVVVGDDGRIGQVGRAGFDIVTGNDIQEWHVESLLPAPANAHSHAFQRAMAGLTEQRGPDPTDSFWTWRRLMYQFLDQLTPDDIEAIAAYAQMEMLEAGYATNVEFHYLHNQPGGKPYDDIAELSARIAAATATTGIALTLMPVHYQFGGCDQRDLNHAQRRFGTDLHAFAELWLAARDTLHGLPADTCIGVAPHSMRAIARENLPELLQLAPEAPFHMHLAEQLAEVNEVEQHWGARPVQWLMANAPVDQRWCLIHCTQMTRAETRALAHSGAVAGLCPITESSLGDGIFNGVEYLDAGGRLAIGSDSNIRISLSEELRTLEYSQRLRDHSRAALSTTKQSTGRRLYEQVVAGGAQAAGRHSGAIEIGRWADLLALDGRHVDLDQLNGDTLLDTFIFAGDDRMVSEVWAAGRHQVTQGEHVNRCSIEQGYRLVMRKLRAFKNH